MDLFRVLATVPRRSSGGVAYRYTVWMGEYSSLECTEEEAKADAREMIRTRNPQLTNYTLELERASSHTLNS